MALAKRLSQGKGLADATALSVSPACMAIARVVEAGHLGMRIWGSMGLKITPPLSFIVSSSGML